MAVSAPERAGSWPRVAQCVSSRRAELGLTLERAAARAGVDVATWERIETAARPGYRAHRVQAVCRSLGWTDDSFDRVLAGGEPRVLAAAASPAKLPVAPRLLRPLAVRAPDGTLELCPARMAIVAGVLVEALAVVVYFHV